MCPSTLFYLVYLVYYVMMQGLFSRITNSMEKSEIFYSKFYEKVGVILAVLFFFFGILSFFWKITISTTEFNLDFLHVRTTSYVGGNQNEKATKSYLLNHIPPHCAQSIVTDLLNLCYCSCSCYPWHCSLIQMSCNI